jgi:Cu(I)/Ag(I) efflux system membrane fusion protein
MNSKLTVLFTLLSLGFAACGGETEAPASSLSSDAERALVEALEHYEGIRAALAVDHGEDAAGGAGGLAAALRGGETAAGDGLGRVFADGARAADALAEAASLEAMRDAFSPLSKALVTLTAAVPRLEKGRYLFECPMVDGFNLWIQEKPDIENPYMGTSMPRCGSQVSWDMAPAPPASSSPDEPAAHEHDPAEIAFYTCPMHPSVKQSGPGTCPICSMDLTPVTRHELDTGIMLVDGTRRQLIGLRTERVSRKPVVTTMRTVGRVTVDESRLTDVTIKYDGYIGELHADETGERVARGGALFTVYSPEMFSAQQEFLAALESVERALKTGVPDRADYLAKASRERLLLWDLTNEQINSIAERGRPMKYVPVLSPASGYVIEKNVVAGAAVMAGRRLLRIAALDRVWVEADLYENELPLVDEGQEVTVSLPYRGSEPMTGRVTFVSPVLDPKSRTARVRIEFDNPGLALKPDMFADVSVTLARGERLVVPEEAVIFAGERRVVFLDLGEGRLRPQPVKLGPRTDEGFEVVSGLTEGDVVVTSGNFLIAAESRLKTAMEQW